MSTQIDTDRVWIGSNKEREKKKHIDLSKYKFEGIDKRQVLRNMVAPELGKYIFEQLTKGN